LLFALTVLGVIVLLAFFHPYAAKNHLGENTPSFAGNFATGSPGPANELTVLSYNISYGRDIDGALAEIRELRYQKTLDIVLLQEMEEAGTERMARALGMNYVYFPAAVEPKFRRNFGNAVLSRWPILASHKLFLPHRSLSDRMKRIATRALIRVQDADVLVYSLHTEPVFILPKFKQDQDTAVLKDIGMEARLVIVGGDFNLFTEAQIEKIERHYGQAGFVRASRGVGYTFTRFGMQMSPDQIFAKGFVVKAAGRMPEAKASDHLPVWATLCAGNESK
jgi:endonuclease/exonuclease/phosphatase family metal-dependent hydrolase